MLRALVGFVAGVALAPVVRQYARPALRELIKKGLVAGAQVQKLAAEVQEDLEDLAAEAAAEAEAKTASKTAAKDGPPKDQVAH